MTRTNRWTTLGLFFGSCTLALVFGYAVRAETPRAKTLEQRVAELEMKVKTLELRLKSAEAALERTPKLGAQPAVRQ